MSHHDWHVGMEVVCIDASHPGIAGWPLEQNRIYRVERLFVGDAYYNGRPAGDCLLLELFGIRNPLKVTQGFLASRFRALEKRGTDISVFTRLLREVREPERA